ncbi:MAG: AAA family ATPase, partial [Actinomycetota bacterium]|nr:AAA family ATPase [Actinomycetota bacterium]
PRDSGADVMLGACAASPPPAPKPASTQPSTPRGKIVAVWGPKGGPGRTTIAAELAAELAAVARDTLLVDADPYGGDMLQLAGILEEVPTVIWAAQMAGKEELDAGRLALDLRRIGSSGPVILPGLPRSELWPEVSDFGWRQLLVVARASFRFTVCDVGFCLEPDPSPYPGATEGRNRMARATVAAADHVVAVCRADPVGVKNFLWSFEQLTALVSPDDVYVVVNRVGPGTEREIGDLLRRHLGKRPIAYIPDRSQELALAVRQGAPVREVKPGSDISSGMRGLAVALGAHVPPRGLLTRLAGRT